MKPATVAVLIEICALATKLAAMPTIAVSPYVVNNPFTVLDIVYI
jgi:ABC-type sugar transport system substrate-binding protein